MCQILDEQVDSLIKLTYWISATFFTCFLIENGLMFSLGNDTFSLHRF